MLEGELLLHTFNRENVVQQVEELLGYLRSTPVV
jgi:hypothetical protein